MYGNNYMGMNQYGQYNPNYMQGYQAYQQQPLRQQPAQPVQNQDVPFSEVRYGTLDEAKAYIVMPTKSVMIINRGAGEFYIKTANSMGEPTLETFKYASLDGSLDEKSDEPKVEYVKLDDLKDYIKSEQLEKYDAKFIDMENKFDKILRLIGGKGDGK